MSEPSRLTRLDWTMAAMAAMARGGVDAVKVDSLAKALKVTRGSFYWHFRDRSDLLSALLDCWEQQFTGSLIDAAEAEAGPADRLRAVSVLALEAETLGGAYAGIEDAMRAWAVHDSTVRDRICKVDDARVNYIALELGRLGHGAERSLQWGRVIYLALIGLDATRPYNSALADTSAYQLLVELVIAQAPHLT